MERKKYKAGHPHGLFNLERLDPVMRAILHTYHLPNIYRAGWVEEARDINLLMAESVAEHTIGMEYIADFLRYEHFERFPDVEWNNVCPMIRVHDLSEIITGDKTPADKMDPNKKMKDDRTAFKIIFRPLFNSESQCKLWEEFLENKTPTAKFVHQIDFLQMIIKARIYFHLTGNVEFHNFYSPEKREKKLCQFLNTFFEQLLN